MDSVDDKVNAFYVKNQGLLLLHSPISYSRHNIQEFSDTGGKALVPSLETHVA